MTVHKELANFFRYASTIRQRLADANIEEKINFGFKAEGYPAHSEMTVLFWIDLTYGYGKRIEGSDPDEVIREFFHRHGYEKVASQPLLMAPHQKEAVAGTDGDGSPIPEGEQIPF